MVIWEKEDYHINISVEIVTAVLILSTFSLCHLEKDVCELNTVLM